LLVSVEPPVIGQSFGLGGEDIGELVLSPRYQGDSLFPIGSYPVSVSVYRLVNSEESRPRTALTPADVELVAWGEIYETAEEASAATLGHV
jgi:hypothetical protein